MPKTNKTASAERLQFVEPMYARAVQQLPDGKDWLYEVKFDGFGFAEIVEAERHEALALDVSGSMAATDVAPTRLALTP